VMPVTSARLVIAASSIELFYTQEFQQLAEDKFRIVNQVSPPEPQRLRQQAKQPFQAVPAHPGGRLLQSACVEIERLPYTHKSSGSNRWFPATSGSITCAALYHQVLAP
jgi:hypothetical protein